MPHRDKRKLKKAKEDPYFESDYYFRKAKRDKAQKKVRKKKTFHQVCRQINFIRKSQL